MAIEEEFSIEIPDKDADKIHSGTSTSSYPEKLESQCVAFAKGVKSAKNHSPRSQRT